MEEKLRKSLGAAEIEIIINNWKTYAPKLRGAKKKSYLYKQMCRDLKKTYQIVLTEAELRKQINLLTNRYRTEKEKIESSGTVPTDWEYFEQINELMEESVCTSERVDSMSSPHSPSSSSSTILETSSDDMACLPFASAPKIGNNNASLPELQKTLEKAYKNCLKKCLENDAKLINLLTVILDKNKTIDKR